MFFANKKPAGETPREKLARKGDKTRRFIVIMKMRGGKTGRRKEDIGSPAAHDQRILHIVFTFFFSYILRRLDRSRAFRSEPPHVAHFGCPLSNDLKTIV